MQEEPKGEGKLKCWKKVEKGGEKLTEVQGRTKGGGIWKGWGKAGGVGIINKWLFSHPTSSLANIPCSWYLAKETIKQIMEVGGYERGSEEGRGNVRDCV